jgi:hypothetical protein
VRLFTSYVLPGNFDGFNFMGLYATLHTALLAQTCVYLHDQAETLQRRLVNNAVQSSINTSKQAEQRLKRPTEAIDIT